MAENVAVRMKDQNLRANQQKLSNATENNNNNQKKPFTHLNAAVIILHAAFDEIVDGLGHLR